MVHGTETDMNTHGTGETQTDWVGGGRQNHLRD